MLSMYVSRDHKDWDATLPFVRFAYNTSKQETTGKSPFYLMHGRHPVLPVDAIVGANPDPYHLAEGRAGGPEKYETWMLENLQRAYAEVDDKNQRAQRKYKQHYDKQRREGEKFQPSQQVLVYRPTRKVGLAEKLLHRWHGPYRIIRQLTPLNYEIQLIPGNKKEVVHVERIKSFNDLTTPNPTKDYEAQATDQTDAEDTADSDTADDETQTTDHTVVEDTPDGTATDDDTPAGQPQKKTTPPNKQPKGKTSGFPQPKKKHKRPRRQHCPRNKKTSTRTADIHYAYGRNDSR
jgi:hypothetical protein